MCGLAGVRMDGMKSVCRVICKIHGRSDNNKCTCQFIYLTKNDIEHNTPAANNKALLIWIFNTPWYSICFPPFSAFPPFSPPFHYTSQFLSSLFFATFSPSLSSVPFCCITHISSGLYWKYFLCVGGKHKRTQRKNVLVDH